MRSKDAKRVVAIGSVVKVHLLRGVRIQKIAFLNEFMMNLFRSATLNRNHAVCTEWTDFLAEYSAIQNVIWNNFRL